MISTDFQDVVNEGFLPASDIREERSATAQIQALNMAKEQNFIVQPHIQAATSDFMSTKQASPVVANKTSAMALGGDAKPWLKADENDPPPEQPWYTPARYLARQLVIEDCTLPGKKLILAGKVSMALISVGIYKRGGKKGHAAETVLKAFSNVTLG